MKLENCGRCGLEPVEGEKVGLLDRNGDRLGEHQTFKCPTCFRFEVGEIAGEWNATQFALKTERINAAAVAIDCAYISLYKYLPGVTHADCVAAAQNLIDAQDAAARVRWAEMQKGE